MTNTYDKRGRSRKSTAVVFMVIFLSLYIFSGIFPDLRANASVTIKTQQAADSIKNGIRGIDVSKYQGTINWEKVATDDVKFAMCRASIGTDTDPTFVTNATEALENGLHVGAYHYARFKDSAGVKKEAAAFMKQLKKVTLTYPAVLDIENHYNLSKTKLTNLAIEFMEILKDNGYRVMIYSYQNFFTGHLNLSKLEDYNIWAANYLEKPVDIDHVMWQHTAYGKVKGISGYVDINIAYKSLSVKKSASAVSATALSASKAQTREPTAYETIISFLNEQYEAGLDAKNNLTMDEINQVIYSAFQKEINKQLGENIKITGVMDEYSAKKLADITFVQDQTQGRITTLIQCKLYFKKHSESINGVYDGTMVNGIKSLQTAFGLDSTGKIDYDTWLVILNLKA